MEQTQAEKNAAAANRRIDAVMAEMLANKAHPFLIAMTNEVYRPFILRLAEHHAAKDDINKVSESTAETISNMVIVAASIGTEDAGSFATAVDWYLACIASMVNTHINRTWPQRGNLN